MWTKLKLETQGIRDADGIFLAQGLGYDTQHWPYIVMHEKPTGLLVRALAKQEEVLKYDDRTLVLKQWPGQQRSDFFVLTVGQLRVRLVERAAAEKAREEKLAASRRRAEKEKRGGAR